MALKFQGGIKFPDFKNTKKLPITLFDRPSVITLAMDNGLLPCVRCGDDVLKYEKIAFNEEGFSIASPIAGKVIVADRRYVIIENSFISDTNSLSSSIPADTDKPKSIEEIDFQKLLDYCKRYGVTGTFSGIPLHIKLGEAYGKCERLIINCVESDPSSGHVRAMVSQKARELILGVKVILKAMGVKKAVIAVDKKFTENEEALKKYIEENSGIIVAPIFVRYPIGCERLLLNAIYNTEMPSDSEVWQIGYPVISAETVINLYQALRDGRPVVYKTLSVSGDAVINPKNLCVPIGTRLAELFDECGVSDQKCVYAVNGLINGYTAGEDAPVGRNTNTAFAMKEKAAGTGNCLKCARCTIICPMHLVPFKFHENYETGKHDENISLGLYNCIECGCCAYMCAGKVDLLGEIRIEKYRSLTKEEVTSETVVFEPVGTPAFADNDNSTPADISESHPQPDGAEEDGGVS